MGEKDYKLFGGNFYGNIKCEKATKEVEPWFMKCNEKKKERQTNRQRHVQTKLMADTGAKFANF